MQGRIIIEGNSVYETDEACMQKKRERAGEKKEAQTAHTPDKKNAGKR